MFAVRGRYLPLTRVSRGIVVRCSGLCQYFLFRSDTRFLGVRLGTAVSRGGAGHAIQASGNDTGDYQGAGSRHSWSSKDGGAALFHVFGVPNERRLVLTGVNRRSYFVVNDFTRHACRFARERYIVREVGFQAGCFFLFRTFVVDRAFRPFHIYVKLGRFYCYGRHFFAVTWCDCVHVCIFVGFDQVGVRVGRFYLLNVDDGVAYCAIVGARSRDGGCVTFVNVGVEPRVSVRAWRPFVREIFDKRDERSRRHASNECPNLFSGDTRFLLDVSWLRTLSGGRRQALYLVGRVDDRLREFQVNVEGEGVAAGVVRFDEDVFHLFCLYVFNGIGGCEAKAAAFYGVGDTYRDP